MRPTAPNVLFTPPPADILWLVVDAVVEPEYHLLAKFDNQARVRRATLHSCALVCKGMLHRAMYHLYNEVSLHDHWRASLFARTMAERRELAPLVKHLSLGLGQCLSEEEDDFRTPLPADVVVLLSNLNSLTLDGESDWPGMRPEALDFAKLFPASCPSLDKLVLTRLEFESFVDFVGLVWSFPRIRHLAMSRLFIPRTDGGMPVGGDDDLTKSLIESTRVNDLTTLIMKENLFPMSMFKFSHMWGTNVKTLALCPGPHMNYRDLSSFVRLEELTLAMEVSAVTHVLRYIRSKHLRIVDITHTVGHQRYDSLLKYLQRHCGDMDVILSKPMFSGLRRISWTVTYRPYSDQRDDARWVQDITGCWPRARDSGILHVSARRY